MTKTAVICLNIEDDFVNFINHDVIKLLKIITILN